MPIRVDQDDPITRLLAPPVNETSEQRSVRLAREAEARRISDEIDQKIQQERDALKSRHVLKMLLLGQSESGKSTTLKNIQRIQAPDTWKTERAAWITVIQLNLVRAVNQILDAIAAEIAEASGVNSSDGSSVSPPTSSAHGGAQEDLEFPGHSDASSSAPIPLSERYNTLRLQFAPLRGVEVDLKMALGAAADEVTESTNYSSMVATPFESPSSRLLSSPRRRREFCVRSHEAWKNGLADSRPSNPRRSPFSTESTEVIAAFRSDMKGLWRDSLVRDVIARRKVTLEDSAEYFLDNVDRIASRHFEPTDDDVVRARLRTVGVQEYRIPFTRGKFPVDDKNKDSLGKEWRIYDVGGARTTRATWLPYFEDVHAILFLAPISNFDERLAEDRSVFRLKDSFMLWKSIVGSKMLCKCVIILFLNKCDLLEKKLKNGVKVNKYIPRYGERENNKDAFGKYIREKFRDYMNEYSPERRPFYGFLTSVVDTKATAATLMSIQDGILQSHLEKGYLL